MLNRRSNARVSDGELAGWGFLSTARWDGKKARVEVRTELFLEENASMLHQLERQRLGRSMREIARGSHGLVVMRRHPG